MILNINRFKILEEFTADYNKRIYGRNVAKKLKMNQKTVSNVLNELEMEHVLRFVKEGKNKYYSLNEFYPYMMEIIHLIETQRKINFIEKYKKIRNLFSKLEERTEGMLIIFGSYASFGANEKSDLDVLAIGKIKNVEDIEDIYNIKINIIKINENKFDKNEHIVKEIIKNHIILKGTENFIYLIWQV